MGAVDIQKKIHKFGKTILIHVTDVLAGCGGFKERNFL